MVNQFSRTELLLGEEAMKKLKNSRVAVFGIGGVGGYVVEALVRSGIGAIDIIDNDTVDITNINRQIYATMSSVGKQKTDVAEARCMDINPELKLTKHNVFYLPETADLFDFTQYDYVVDAIDTVTGKLMLIEEAKRCNVPIICSMGAGNKLDPTAFEVADISKTSVCPLARVIRNECKKRGLKNIKCVYSKEYAIEPEKSDDMIIPEGSSRRSLPGSCAFVPSVAGLIIASEVIKDLVTV